MHEIYIEYIFKPTSDDQMFFDPHLNLYDTCYESAFTQKTTVSSFISTNISLFLPLIVEETLPPDLMIYSLSNPGNTIR